MPDALYFIIEPSEGHFPLPIAGCFIPHNASVVLNSIQTTREKQQKE